MSRMLAGERMKRVLGITSAGHPIYAISGSEGENEGGKEGETTEGNKEGEGGSTGGSGEGGSGTAEQPKMVSEEEYQTILRRLEAADRAKGEIAKQLKQYEDKDKSELEKLQGELKELKDKADRAAAEALQAKLSNEILKFPGFVWHDPEAVLRLVDMEMISVGEDGKVTGVKDALTKLAKDKAYLLKGKQDNKGGGGSGSGNNGSSGHNPGGSADTADKNKRRDELTKRYKLRG